jgi:hypothetical protein
MGRQDSEQCGSKHFRNLNCFQFLPECNFDFIAISLKYLNLAIFLKNLLSVSKM